MSTNGYQKQEWNDFSTINKSIMTLMMVVVHQKVAAKMQGHTLDVGCGSAKAAPFVLEQAAVNRYTGVDYAETMVRDARWLIAQFPEKPAEILCGKIEELPIKQQFDACFSINSYYAWKNHQDVLSHIHQLLRDDGVFVLVTPNRQIDMRKLLRVARKEIIAHPYYEAFCEMNLAFCDNSSAFFIDMDELIKQTQSVGFRVLEAHQELYLGGLNFLYMRK